MAPRANAPVRHHVTSHAKRLPELADEDVPFAIGQAPWQVDDSAHRSGHAQERPTREDLTSGINGERRLGNSLTVHAGGEPDLLEFRKRQPTLVG